MIKFQTSSILFIHCLLVHDASGFAFPQSPRLHLKTKSAGKAGAFITKETNVRQRLETTSLYIGKELDKGHAAVNWTRSNDGDVLENRFVKGMEAGLNDLQDYISDAKNANKIELNSATWNPQDQVSTKYQDPLFKLVAANIEDPALRLVSSEVGVQQWIWEELRRTNKLPDSGQLPVDILVQRTMDTIEDVMVHLRRIPFERGTATLTPAQDAKRKTVVVLGSGWAAHALMKVADCTKLRLIVVSPANHFVFTPMLTSSAVGTVEYRSMTEAVRSANPMIEEYLEGKATEVDVLNKRVEVQLNSLLEDFREGEPPQVELDYDHLIVSVGCKVNDRGVPGADRALRLKTLDDARRLRAAIGECFEYASRPDVAGNDKEKVEERTRRTTFLIVGGGSTGVELAGELLDLAADVTRPHKGTYPKLKDNIRVVVVHSGPDLVPQFEPRLRIEAKIALEKKGCAIIFNTYVTEVGDGFAKLSTKIFDENGEVIGREELTVPSGLTVWCAGTSPVSFVEELLSKLPDEARNPDGRIKVDKWMRPVKMPSQELMGSIFVLGDAAAFPETNKDISTDQLLPQTAQVAGQQGAYAARILDRGYDLTTTPPTLIYAESNSTNDDPLMVQWLQLRGMDKAPPFVFLNLGLLAYVGGGEALAKVQIGDFPLFSYFGSVAFVLWRSVYLVKQVATRNRILVTFDWIKSALFGRDMTRF